MSLRFRNTVASVGILASAIVFSTNSVRAQESTACSERYNVAWEIPLRSADIGKQVTTVLERSEFSTVRNLFGDRSRVAIGRAPDNTISIQMNIPKGENRTSTFFLDPLGNPGVDAACLSLRVYFQNGFEWARGGGGTKLGFGLWGGDRPSNLSGGTWPNDQEGWSVRNVNSQYGFRLYSYHLNRPGRFGQQGGAGLARWGSSDWQPGQWHDIDLEVVMNDIGKSNGYAQLWLNGKYRQSMTNLRFRNKTSWAIRGLYFSDIWGGTTSDPNNFSPKAQKMWYANYTLYTESTPASSQQSSTSSPSDTSSTPTNTDTSQSSTPPSTDSSPSGSTTTEASVPSFFFTSEPQQFEFASEPQQFESLLNRHALFDRASTSNQPSRFSSFADRFPSFGR